MRMAKPRVHPWWFAALLFVLLSVVGALTSAVEREGFLFAANLMVLAIWWPQLMQPRARVGPDHVLVVLLAIALVVAVAVGWAA